MLKQQEFYEARLWHRRSRERTMVSRRFGSHAKVKAKWAREELEVLEGEDGESMTEKEEILEGIYEFYQELFTAEPQTDSRKHALIEVLDLVQRRISRTESEMKSSEPYKKETEAVVFTMPSNKAPGSAKNGPNGFHKAIFVKIDFVKAYDRVDHEFLWGILQKMGFDNKFVELVQGFTLCGKAKVHINWAFAKEIQLQHGVRQGCPVAPLLKIGSGKLERLMREFLWGSTPEGIPKKSLVAWKRIQRPKEKGGLGFLSVESRAEVLQIRHITAILDGTDVEWAAMVRRMVRVKLITGPNKIERADWSCEDAMLLLSAMRIPEAPTVDKLFRIWFFFKRNLVLS
ncbi:hypothetical protein R1sor_022641 [Riccia sorocarpa]|uniref:Reverse transcriptase domain-containing protein n=1 Tax=Riccia sorocarpa TaxID=122646 RepID=A0ABD3GNL8_9MARC